MPSYRVISIGAMSAHHLWGERGDARPGHATTTLIEVGERRIIVDPSLPAKILLSRMAERTNVRPEQITDIFVTSLNPLRRRGVDAFPSAACWVAEAERDAYAATLAEKFDEATEADDEELERTIQTEQVALSRFNVAPDELAPKVALFPLVGVTPGNAGLLLSQQRSTVLICGDAIPTLEHLERGAIMQGAFDVEAAQESFREAVEIADVLVLGRDNAVLNPLRVPY